MNTSESPTNAGRLTALESDWSDIITVGRDIFSETDFKEKTMLSGSLGQYDVLVTAKLLLQPGNHSWIER